MSLEQIWAGWRSEYVSSAGAADAEGSEVSGEGCVFCRLAAAGEPDQANGILWRGEHSLAVLNLYPYTNGHVLLLPLRHAERLGDLEAGESAELWTAVLASVEAIECAYKPDGVNLGANLGRAAGAGIPAHVHLHALPRWSGDTNFMTTVAGARVMPEPLSESWQRLHTVWPA